jgi:hypothetical protein
MEPIEKLTNELDAEITRLWNEYAGYHNQLMPHFDKPIGDNVNEINALLKSIQDTFALLNVACHFIDTRHQFATNAMAGYKDFIDRLIKGGAKQGESEESPVVEG